MSRRTTLLAAALAASALAASPALADPHAIDSHNRSDSPAATSTKPLSPGDSLPAYPTPKSSKPHTIEDGRSADARDAGKDATVQPGQPTWPANPKVLTPPRPDGSTRGGSTDNDDIWLVLGIGLAATALAGGAAGAARYSRVRARRVAV